MRKKLLFCGLTLMLFTNGSLISYCNTNTNNSLNNITLLSSVTQIGEVTATVLNVRSGSSTSSKIIGSLKKGTTVTVIQKKSNGWYKIKYGSGYGYVIGSYLTVTTQSTDTPSTDNSTSTTLPIGTVTANALNVRDGSSISTKVIGSLKKGDTVTIVQKESNGWYKIKYGSGYGYISGFYLIITTEPTDIEQIGTVTARVLNVRDRNSVNSKIIGSLNKGASITVIQKESNGWYKIIYGSEEGYVSGSYLTVIIKYFHSLMCSNCWAYYDMDKQSYMDIHNNTMACEVCGSNVEEVYPDFDY